MTLRRKHILGWILFIPCLLGVLAGIGIGEYFFWVKGMPVAILVHSCVAAVGLLCVVGHYGEKWQDSKNRWKRRYAYGVATIPSVAVIGGGLTGYCVLWVQYWQAMVIGHLLGAVAAGAIAGFLLVRSKKDA